MAHSHSSTLLSHVNECAFAETEGTSHIANNDICDPGSRVPMLHIPSPMTTWRIRLLTLLLVVVIDCVVAILMTMKGVHTGWILCMH